MTRRTVDITVDAYDAPMLAALAKRLTHIRSLGHADGDFVSPPNNARWGITCHDMPISAREIKQLRELEEASRDGVSDLTIIIGELAELIETRTPRSRLYEALDVAAVGVRIASKMARDIDAKGGE